jgi:hypothetical protein
VCSGLSGALSQPVFADLQDWQVLEDGNEIGRIYEQHAPANPDQA